jgi:hypothetical protein
MICIYSKLLAHPPELALIGDLEGSLSLSRGFQCPEGLICMMTVCTCPQSVLYQQLSHRIGIRADTADTLVDTSLFIPPAWPMRAELTAQALQAELAAYLFLLYPTVKYVGHPVFPYSNHHFLYRIMIAEAPFSFFKNSLRHKTLSFLYHR